MKHKIAGMVIMGMVALVQPALAFSCALRGRTVIDQAGREIAANKPFDRIISLYGAHTENLFALGLDSSIIGVSRNERYPEAARKKAGFSYHDDPEKFLAVRPDLVLIRPMIDRGYAALVQRLEKSGVTVISLQPGSIDEMFVYWRILGVLAGKQERAGYMVRQFKHAVSSLKKITGNIYPKKKVYFESIHKKMKTFTRDSMAIFALETAGGINIGSDALSSRGTNIANYGKERILSHASKIDVYLAQKGSMNQPTVEIIKAESGFHLIRAVEENQIFIISEMIVSRPTPRLLNGILEIGKNLYPDIFTRKFIETTITRTKVEN